ncbi:fasciclin-like arabinogalactan protein 14 [Typha latifolia]|uniref:fasciclin-like arabinogalactan protein 14 n=1 Tax=Typha latifolia TaxID=4733 RepID=UPI003C2D3BB1
MASESAVAVLLPIFLFVFLTATAAHNITEILEAFDDFSSFNNLLNQTKLNNEINHRQTITVLAIADSAIGPLASLPTDALKKALSVHVILDYYDTDKLSRLRNRSAIFTTLFQTTGLADDRMGFLNFTKKADGEMLFGSAVPGAPVVSHLIKVLATKPYNISVLQISAPIIPPGVENTGNVAPPPPPIAAAPKKGPTPSLNSPTIAPTSDVIAPTPVEEINGPAADAPTASPPSPVADAPTDAPIAGLDAPASAPTVDSESHSSAQRVVVGASIGLTMGVIFLSAL